MVKIGQIIPISHFFFRVLQENLDNEPKNIEKPEDSQNSEGDSPNENESLENNQNIDENENNENVVYDQNSLKEIEKKIVINALKDNDASVIFAQSLIDHSNVKENENFDSLIETLKSLQSGFKEHESSMFFLPEAQFGENDDKQTEHVEYSSDLLKEFVKQDDSDFFKNMKRVNAINPQEYIDNIINTEKKQHEIKITSYFSYKAFRQFKSIYSISKKNELFNSERPLIPFLDDLSAEITKLVSYKMDIIPPEKSRRYGILIASLFVNGFRKDKFFSNALKDLSKLYPPICSSVSYALRFNATLNRVQTFVNLLINTNQLKFVLNTILSHEEWTNKYYLNSSLIKYGDVLIQALNIIDLLGTIKFTLPITGIEDEYLEFYYDLPAFKFVEMETTDDPVRLLIQLLDSYQVKRIIKDFAGNDIWRFLAKIVNLYSNPQLKKNCSIVDEFISDFNTIQGNGILDPLLDQKAKLYKFFNLAYQKKIIAQYFLIIVCHQELVKLEYEPCSNLLDPFRAKFISKSLAQRTIENLEDIVPEEEEEEDINEDQNTDIQEQNPESLELNSVGDDNNTEAPPANESNDAEPSPKSDNPEEGE